MSATAFFFRTLLRASAAFVGAAMIFLHPSLEWRGGQPDTVVAQQAPREAAVNGLIAALGDSDAGVRREAARALGMLEAQAAVDALAKAIKDASPEVRRAVVQALGQIGDPKVVDVVTQALKDAEPAIRRAAALALAQLAADGPHPHPHPRPNPVVR